MMPGGEVAGWRRGDPSGAVEQDRTPHAVADRAVDRPARGRWQRDQREFGAFAQHTQDTVAVLLVEVLDGRVAGFEGPQPE